MFDLLVLVALVSIVLLLVVKRAQPINAIKVIDHKEDITTLLPMPLKASLCSHHWDVITNSTLDMPHEKKHVTILVCHDCGSIDKTLAVTSPAPPPPWSRATCKHKWERERAVELDSQYEQLVKGQKKSVLKRLPDVDECPEWMFRKKYVSVRVCVHCGLTFRIITSNLPGDDTEEAEILGSDQDEKE